MADKLAKRRQCVLNELISSERTYLESLKKAVSIFRAALECADPPVLSPPEVQVLFGNIDEVVRVSAAFMADISAPSEHRERTVLDVLHRYCSDGTFFDAYCSYVMRYPKSCELLSICCTAHHPFSAWYAERSEQCGILSGLSSFLVMPIQRIPRYMLFAQELLKHTGEQESMYEQMRTTFQSVQEIASEMNETKRHIEKSAGIMKVLGFKASSLLMAEGPMIFQDDSVGKSGAGAHLAVHVFLFHDAVAVAKCDASGSPTHLIWHVDLINADIQETETGKFVVSEVRRIKTYPFVYVASYVLVATHPPHDDSFWRSSFDAAMESFWRDESKKVDVTKVMDRHMTENLLTEEDWALMSIGGSTQEYNLGDHLMRHGEVNDSLFVIESGSVDVLVPAARATRGDGKMLVGSMRSGAFFGELSMLSSTPVAATADIVASENLDSDRNPRPTVATAIPFVLLHSTLRKRPELGMRFFQLVCFKLATRFVQQPLRAALKKEEEADQKKKADFALRVNALKKPASIQERSTALLRTSKNESLHTLTRSADSEEDRDNSPRRRSHLDDAASAKREKILRKMGLSEETIAASFGVKTEKKLAGELFIMRRHLGFRGTFFRKHVNVVIAQEEVASVAAKETHKIAIGTAAGKQHLFAFRSTAERQEALGILMNFKPMQRDMLRMLSASSRSSNDGRAAPTGLQRMESVELNNEEWMEMLESASITTYRKDEVIIAEGERPLTLFQLEKGSARVEVPLAGAEEEQSGGRSPRPVAARGRSSSMSLLPAVRTKTVGRMECGAIFGEVSFVLGSLATAYVIADEDDTEVVCFKRNAVAELFGERPDLGAGFYHFLAVKLRELFLKVETAAQS